MRIANKDELRVVVTVSERVRGKSTKKTQSITIYETTGNEVVELIKGAVGGK